MEIKVDPNSEVLLAPGALERLPELLRHCFGEQPALVVADRNTWEVAGRAVFEGITRAGRPAAEPFVFDDTRLQAEHSLVEQLQSALADRAGAPIAVGAGTINDLTKLAAHRLGRPYIAVATAASMDGYTAFGASITFEGSKQTFACPAPVAVVADLDILTAAPPAMSASGYADLLAKVTAGADWLLADALGEEPLDAAAWDEVHGGLRLALDDPEGVRRGEPDSIRRLMQGLLACGTAMQLTQTSRPASGAEHQFSHLWDMEEHRHEGVAPPHGFKVGVAVHAVTRLYELLLSLPLEELDIDRALDRWPSQNEMGEELEVLFPGRALLNKAREETAAKALDAPALRAHLERVRAAWPELRGRLSAHLLPSEEVRARLREVGAPVDPEEIGISQARLRASFRKACFLRRRYTILDLALRTGLLEESLNRISPGLCRATVAATHA